ncbi:MAG: carboxypeptidase-like regulatory domain-containing protein [Bacteroidota bacterium]
MNTEKFTWLLFLMIGSTTIFAQKLNLSIHGTIANTDSNIYIQNAVVILSGNGKTFQTNTNTTGEYTFTHLGEGIYNIYVYKKDYITFEQTSIQVTSSKKEILLQINLRHKNARKPIIAQRRVSAIRYYSRLEKRYSYNPLVTAPNQNINMIAAYVRGVDSRNGETPSIRGARPEGTAYYIDGVRIANPNTEEIVIGKQ